MRFQLDRAALDAILENQALLLHDVRVVPERQNGIVGLRLSRIRPDSLLGTLGLRSEDRLDAINGYEVGDPERALEAYARLRTAERLEVAIRCGSSSRSGSAPPAQKTNHGRPNFGHDAEP